MLAGDWLRMTIGSVRITAQRNFTDDTAGEWVEGGGRRCMHCAYLHACVCLWRWMVSVWRSSEATVMMTVCCSSWLPWAVVLWWAHTHFHCCLFLCYPRHWSSLLHTQASTHISTCSQRKQRLMQTGGNGWCGNLHKTTEHRSIPVSNWFAWKKNIKKKRTHMQIYANIHSDMFSKFHVNSLSHNRIPLLPQVGVASRNPKFWVSCCGETNTTLVPTALVSISHTW